MRFISLFAGVGGFDLALERLGHECVYANDIDKYCKTIYEKRFKRELDNRSIKDVPENEIPTHEVLCGGFPCQSFSIAGKRRGFEDTRGTLFFDIARIARYHKPRILFLENVKGLLSHDNGRTFKTIIATLAELGYDCEWQVLNSSSFGVPQSRPRIYIIGHLRGTSGRKVFPIRGSNKKDTRIVGKDISYAIDANYAKGTNTLSKNRRQLVALVEKRSQKAKEIRREMMKKGIDWSPRREKELVARTDGKIGALTAARNFDTLVTDGIRIRRLSPLECERLQSFEDNHTKEVSDTQRYKQMGNAVTVNVIYEIAKRLL